jgi:hypothetical protein
MLISACGIEMYARASANTHELHFASDFESQRYLEEVRVIHDIGY